MAIPPLESPLTQWGWSPHWQAALEQVPEAQDLVIGRILSQREDTLMVATEEGVIAAHPAGVLFHKCSSEELPAVGDWVGLELCEEDEGALVNLVLPRRSRFLREAPGGRGVAQLVACNIDLVFLVSPVSELNLNRLERFLVAIHAGGAEPCVVLSKADLVSEQQLLAASTQVRGLQEGLRLLTSRTPWDQREAVQAEFATVFEPGATCALVGTSGAGKSTLLNTLAGEDLQETASVREGDGKGRHVTSFRELFALPNGALMMDTPGMREFALWSDQGGLEAVFHDLVELEASCRFNDCAHDSEPGCAVQEAIEQGQLSTRRLENWRGLRQEMEENEARRDRRQARRERSEYRRKKKRDKRFSR